jgi:phosphopantetheine--protein transferase-like protein
MDSIENIKTIVAHFLNCTPDLVKDSSVIDREALHGSIMVNRMFAVLKSAGIEIDDYSNIKTFGELIHLIQITGETVQTEKSKQNIYTHDTYNNFLSIGIDIENFDKLPNALDYREEEFYKQNFSPREIAYCILKSNPKESFAGLFTLKEALVKSDQNLRNKRFSDIEILHDSAGKPMFENFSISVSHVDNLVVAIVINTLHNSIYISSSSKPKIEWKSNHFSLKYKLLIFAALILSLISLLIVFFKN